MTKGKRIIFLDIDETLFRTFAKVHIIKNGKTIKKINNKEFNSYKLQEGESFKFEEFKNGKLFQETSQPIIPSIRKTKEIIEKTKTQENVDTKIILLTAREDFYDKENFLDTFRKQGIDVDNKNLVYIERSGNIQKGSVSEKKKQTILKYLETGKYTKCRIVDDDINNIKALEEIANNLSEEIIKKIVRINNIKKGEVIINFKGFQVQKDESVKLIFSKDKK